MSPLLNWDITWTVSVVQFSAIQAANGIYGFRAEVALFRNYTPDPSSQR
jgi:hypothetical protein